MNLIDLFWILFFIGGGAFAGLRLGGWLGALLGAVAGYLLLVAIQNAVAWENSKTPACVCGGTWEQFRDEQEGDHFLRRCMVCGRRYEMLRGSVWRELTPEGEYVLRMRRHFLGKLRSVTAATEERQA